MNLEEVRALADAIRAEVAKAIVGQDDIVDARAMGKDLIALKLFGGSGNDTLVKGKGS